MAHNPGKKQDEHTLKDGRKIWRTHNGFNYFVQDKKGKITPILEKQWLKFKLLKI